MSNQFRQQVPDYLQNDETAADYIKNRPFYTTDPVETELVNGTFAFSNEGLEGGFYASADIIFDLVAGTTYKVTFDSVEYETICQTKNGFQYIGSLEFLIGGTPKYPFIYVPGNFPFTTNIAGDSHDVVIATTQSEVVQIPDKYISDNFRNIIVVTDPKGWSEADWAKYYDLFQSGKLLKLAEGGGSSRESVGYILSMFYKNSIKYATYIDQQGQIFALSHNSTTGNYYWAPIFYSNELYFDYDQSEGSFLTISKSSYKKLGASSSSLTFTTKGIGKDAIERKVVLEGDKSLILSSSTADSTKKFKITVDDTGTLTATEVTG